MRFTAEHNSWERKEDLERDFRKEDLPRKYIAKKLYGWNDGKFEDKYLKKLEKNWQKWKSVSLEKKL